MFDRQNIVFTIVLEKGVATGAVFEEEGMVCVRILEGGYEMMKPSEGIAGERFAGFNVIDNLSPKSEALTVSYIVPTPPFIKLQYNNMLVGQLRIVDTTAGLDSAYGQLTFITTGTPTANQILVSWADGSLTFHSSKIGHTIIVYYKHELTVRQAIQKYSQRTQRTNLDPDIYNQVGVYAGAGTLYTDQYDNTKDYNNVARGELKTGPGGKVTVGGDGDTIGAVIKTPSLDYPYLGIAYTIVNR